MFLPKIYANGISSVKELNNAEIESEFWNIYSIFRIIIYFGIFTNALLITNTSKWSIDYLRNNFNNRVIFFLVFVVLIDFSNENIVYFVVRVFLYES